MKLKLFLIFSVAASFLIGRYLSSEHLELKLQSASSKSDQVTITQAYQNRQDSIHSKNSFQSSNESQQIQKVDYEKLQKLPLHILRKAYEQKMEILENEIIKNRYPQVNEENLIEQANEIFNKILDSDEISEFWIGKSDIEISNKVVPITILFHFYNAEMNRGLNNFKSKIDPENLCWYIATYFEGYKKGWAGSSSCTRGISKTRGSYFVTQMLNVEGIESSYTHFAIEIPIDKNYGNGELLTAKNRVWVKRVNEIQWRPVNKDEFNKNQKMLREK